jgi:hypothetical protein
MSLKTKTIKIGEYDITIYQFGALEALRLRNELVKSVKGQIGNLDLENVGDIVKAIAGLVYELPTRLLLDLFKNCSAMEVGELSKADNFDKVFTNNLDGTIELAMEVLDFNGFFTINIISTLAKKIPALEGMEETLKGALEKKS